MSALSGSSRDYGMRITLCRLTDEGWIAYAYTGPAAVSEARDGYIIRPRNSDEDRIPIHDGVVTFHDEGRPIDDQEIPSQSGSGPPH